MAHERLSCGLCKRNFYGKQKGDKAGRHQTIDPKTGEKTGEWCDAAGQELLVRAIPDALPVPCFVCGTRLGADYRHEGDRYGSVHYAQGLVDYGLGGSVTPVVYGGDARSAGVICPACMMAGKERVAAEWKAIVAEAILEEAPEATG